MIWKIYAILLLVLVLLGMTVGTIDKEPLTKWQLLDIPMSIIGTIGVVAFAFKKVMSKPRFWKIWLILSILWGIVFSIFSPHNIFEGDIVIAIASSLFCLPGYLALFLYVYRSKEIWDKGT